MKQRKRVALLISRGWYTTEVLLQGVHEYFAERDNWVLVPVPENFSGSIRDLDHWSGDGVIASVKDRRSAERVRDLPFPVVGTSGSLPPGLLPRVLTDSVAIGEMGARHLLDCGFRRLVFVGRRGADDVKKRMRGFRNGAAYLGASVTTFMTPSLVATWKAWNANAAKLEQFVKKLTPPIGIMACDDVRAHMVLDACTAVGWRVPDDVAILGVDDNRPVCEACDPPLSSVERPDRETGYRAAALLDQMMTEGLWSPKDLLLPPAGIVERRSTDVLAVEDAYVRAALEYVREHSGESYGVEQLAATVSVSRRWLETRFREVMGCTLHQHLCRTRVKQASELLVLYPKKTIREISEICGFTSPKRFRIVFGRLTGTKPSEYRKQHLGDG